MAAAAETGEVHAESLELLRRWAASLAIRESQRTAEEQALSAMIFEDELTATAEHVGTDSEFCQSLDIERVRTFEIINGKVADADGRPITELVQKGHKTSQNAAAQDPRMQMQEVRDGWDVVVAEEVDELEVSELCARVSMYPRDALLGRDRAFHEGRGYLWGLTFIQFYYKVSETHLIAGSFSIMGDNMEAWQRVQERFGFSIPSDTPADEWIQHKFQQHMPHQWALNYAARLREAYYKEVGETRRRQSVAEFLEANGELMLQYTDRYMAPLAQATLTGRNNEAMRGLAQAIVSQGDTVQKLDHEVVKALANVLNSEAFTSESARAMKKLIQYARIERLREKLPHFIARETATTHESYIVPVDPYLADEALHQQVANNVHSGVMAGRTYSGCVGLTLRQQSENTSESTARSPQEAYGGRGQSGESGVSLACEYVHDGCYCCGFNEDGTPRSSRMKVHARRDKKGDAYCLRPKCNAWLSADGKNSNIGDIARKAKALQLNRNRQVGNLALAA